MDFRGKCIEEIVDIRKQARMWKLWKVCDEIRDFLDSKYVFVYDTKDDNGQYFQEVYYVYESFFEKKDKIERTRNMTNRKYLEFRLKEGMFFYNPSLGRWTYTG